MKITLHTLPLAHSFMLATALLCGSPVLLAEVQNDQPARVLAETGSMPVHAAGPYVEIGTFRVQVLAKLGRPDLKFADGTWLYHGHRAENSAATGTLVVQFKNGRVNSLSLVTPAVLASLEARQQKAAASEFVAVK